jgi:nucleoside-diphosphate-sugar epimerase
MKKIFITGGAGYVGTSLVNSLISKNFKVSVLDLLLFENKITPNKNLHVIKGDIRDQKLLKKVIKDHNILIHLACISNDPSFELNPDLGKKINFDAFEPLVKISRDAGVERFIYASTSSVYGVKKDKNVSEDMSLEPLTDYSRYKAECEKVLNKYKSKDFTITTLRPATVCGFSPRQRLDLVVNILTNLAFHKREITVLGGSQLRPNIHISDMVRAYELFIEADKSKINGEIFNVGFENQTVDELAIMVKNVIDNDVNIKKVKSNDDRSYHISSEKIKSILGFKPAYTIPDAISDLKNAFEKKILKDCLHNSEYFNVKKIQEINLK